VPDLIVLHYTAMASTAEAKDRLCDPAFEVSAHYLISEQGTVLPMVPEDLRAWHAGAGAWGGVTDINSRSIGIEMANAGNTPFSAAQMDALEALMRGIMARWRIPPERVIGHSDMAPGRKIDPGPRFDWRRLARQGLSVWPATDAAAQAAPDQVAFMAAARAFGYTYSTDPALVLQALRLRFRPFATGPLDAGDMGLMLALAHAFPVDPRAPSA
jgi:N-acetylmuramoyl-L-alanine amidase